MFSFEGWRLLLKLWGLGISKLQMLIKKRKKKFHLHFFQFFGHQNPGSGSVFNESGFLDPQHWLKVAVGQIWIRHTGTGMYCCNSCLRNVFRSKRCVCCSWTTGIRTPCPGGAATPSNPTSCFRLWWFRSASSTPLGALVGCHISGARLYPCSFLLTRAFMSLVDSRRTFTSSFL